MVGVVFGVRTSVGLDDGVLRMTCEPLAYSVRDDGGPGWPRTLANCAIEGGGGLLIESCGDRYAHERQATMLYTIRTRP